MPRAHRPLSPEPSVASVSDDALFDMRWRRGEAHLLGPLHRLFGPHHDVEAVSARVRDLLRSHWQARPQDLKALDLSRDLMPEWFLSQEMVAYVFYIDRFAGSVSAVANRLPYLKSLGVTYAHMMPCLKPRPGDSDGGYAVMDYRSIDPALGTMDEFETLTAKMRTEGISPCIDLVLNHTAREHEWAEKARAGDQFFRDFYHIFPDRTLPDQYEEHLLEIFPDQAPGSFTWDEEAQGWVWTTFNSFQWDLNWANPEVYLGILDTILYLANRGVEVFRLDAVAFMWKRMGTVCQNLPPVHDILQAIAQATRIAAPGVIHKAEAIVGPTDLVTYLGQGRHSGRESNLAYHNNLMVQYWSSLASQDTRLMTHVLDTHFPTVFRRASWATYIRCHDDIGWAITEQDAEAMGDMDGPGHRGFLASFYTGDFPDSFAHGADFQVNEETGDRRTNGSFASLAGLEAAVESGDPVVIDRAVQRMLLGVALIAGFGGMPLLYMGDEIGMTNDASYLDDPAKAHDGRWMQRPIMDWERVAQAEAGKEPEARLLDGTRHIIARRKAVPQLAGTVPTEIVDTHDKALFVIRRPADDMTLTAVHNFTDRVQSVDRDALRLRSGVAYRDVLAERAHGLAPRIDLPPYGVAWLLPDE